ncbi:hypothetical protein BDV41DRAFT_561949 [Aspergillus transmontanensis]|uniref:Fe2OG dioxygenase domain-containing protein n=1 Tax=Aspergillus transmontanensis TaxID=1034304 RepID=A0A5N6W728_9EURO|nr:hypothetical protein BDV41DRAFT_561949 [Aspergillus transmontanensis]
MPLLGLAQLPINGRLNPLLKVSLNIFDSHTVYTMIEQEELRPLYNPWGPITTTIKSNRLVSHTYDSIIFYRWTSPDGVFERGRIMARLVAEMMEKNRRRVWLDQWEMRRDTTSDQVVRQISDIFLCIPKVIILAAPGDWDRFTNADDIHRWEWELSLQSDKKIWILRYGVPETTQAPSKEQLAADLRHHSTRLADLAMKGNIQVRVLTMDNLNSVLIEKLNPDGGLVLVPPACSTLPNKAQKRVIDRLHALNDSIVFAQVCDDGSPIDSLSQDLAYSASKKIDLGYDGVEINIGGPMLQKIIDETSDSSTAVAMILKVVDAVATLVPTDQVGIRLVPFSNVESQQQPLEFFCTLIESIASQLPTLCFVHVVAHARFDDFEYPRNASLDKFRGALASASNSIAFISADAYEPETASTIAARTQDLVAISLPAEVDLNLITTLRQGAPYEVAEATADRLKAIRSTFQTGKEYVLEWPSEQERKVFGAMNDLDRYLGELDPALSYEGTDKKVVWRKSCWFASEGISHPFLDTEKAIAAFDGDLHDGLAGLQALQDPSVRQSMVYLKNVLDSALVTTSAAVGIDKDMIQRCTVRYRIIKYTAHAGNPGGIGLHPDGNLLSALITNGDGLRVYDLDGTVRYPGYNGTIMMGGSTLYRWSQGHYPPTFHDVTTNKDQVKVSIVAFFNFPDLVTIPRALKSGSASDGGFFHDIRVIKEDDKLPHGQLSPLWDVIIDKHQLVLPPAVTAK